jgi:hypothetical protein
VCPIKLKIALVWERVSVRSILYLIELRYLLSKVQRKIGHTDRKQKRDNQSGASQLSDKYKYLRCRDAPNHRYLKILRTPRCSIAFIDEYEYSLRW